MPARLAILDTRAINLIAVGLPITEGRAKGEFFKWTSDEECFDAVQDANSELVVRFRKGSRLYTCEVTLLASSRHNAELMAIHAADERSTNGVTIAPFSYNDGNGATLIVGPYSWIKGTPEYAQGEEEQELTWMIHVVAEPSTALIGGR